jgi:hypothetical protein
MSPDGSALCIPLDVILTSTDRPDMRVGAELRSLGEKFLDLVVPIPLCEGINVDVAFGHDSIINTRVTACTADHNLHLLRLSFNADRRRHARIPVEHPALVRRLYPKGPRQRATIIDISRGGLAMMISEPLPAGAVVEIVVRGAVVAGHVRHSRKHEGQYRAGVQMQSVAIDEPSYIV